MDLTPRNSSPSSRSSSASRPPTGSVFPGLRHRNSIPSSNSIRPRVPRARPRRLGRRRRGRRVSGRYRRLILRRLRLILRGGLRCAAPCLRAAPSHSDVHLLDRAVVAGAVHSDRHVHVRRRGLGDVRRGRCVGRRIRGWCGFGRRFDGRLEGRCGDRPCWNRLRGSRLGGNCRKRDGWVDDGQGIELVQARFLEDRGRGLCQIGNGRNRACPGRRSRREQGNSSPP